MPLSRDGKLQENRWANILTSFTPLAFSKFLAIAHIFRFFFFFLLKSLNMEYIEKKRIVTFRWESSWISDWSLLPVAAEVEQHYRWRGGGHAGVGDRSPWSDGDVKNKRGAAPRLGNCVDGLICRGRERDIGTFTVYHKQLVYRYT